MSAICRNVGEIISSTLPLTDAGLHLLDGSLILGGGIYQGFVDYIAELYTANPSANYFTTEALWQQSVTTYGVCGKFVYDSVNNTVRLPKVTGKLDGTTDLTALGDLEPLMVKLPNITGRVAIYARPENASGVFYLNGTGSNVTRTGDYGNYYINFDASRSSSVYSGNGTNTAIHEQAINVLYYIVIANSTKTEIQSDIDEIATDLNGKADTDLSNVPASKGILIESYVNGTSWYRVYSDGWCEQGGSSVLSAVGWATVNFIKSFVDTNYTFIASQGTTGRAGAVNAAIITSKINASSAEWTLYSSTGKAQWYACGYIR